MSYVQSVLGELAVRGRRLLVSPLFYLGLAVVLGVAMFHPPLLGAALALLVGSPVLYHGAVSFVRPLVGRSAGTHQVPSTPVASSPRASVPSGRATGNVMVDTLVDKLRRSGLTVSTDWSFACDVLSRLPDEKYHSLKSHPDKIHGFVYQGVIYINPSSATAEAPLHEYTHVWAEVLRQKNPREWEHIVGLMKQEVSLWDTVKSSYPHLETDDEIADEVLATFSGRYAHAFLQQHALSGRSPRDVLGAVADALDTFWRAVCQFFGCHYSSKEAIAERCLRDLLQGVNPLDYADSRQQLSDRKPLHSLSQTPKHQPVMNQVKSLTLLTGEQARQTLSEILAHAREDGRGDVHYDTRVGAVGYYPDRTGAGDEVYTAFDNSSGDCWCEDFKTALGAQRWCVCHADADDVRRQEAAGLIGLESSVVDTIPLKSDNLGESVTYEYDLGDDEVLSVTMQFSDGLAEELPVRGGKAVPEWNRLQLIYPKLLDIDLDKDHQALVTKRTGKIWKGLSDAQKVVAAAMTFGIAFRLSEQDVLHVREEKIAAVERLLAPYHESGDHQTFFRAVMNLRHRGKEQPSLGLLLDDSGRGHHQMVYRHYEETGSGQTFCTNLCKDLRSFSLSELDVLLNGLGSLRRDGSLLPAVLTEVIDDDLSSDEDVFTGVRFPRPYDQEQQEVGDRYGCEAYRQDTNTCVLPDFDAATNYAYDVSQILSFRGNVYRQDGADGYDRWRVTFDNPHPSLLSLARRHGGDAVMTDVGTPLVMATFGDLRDARAYREEAKVFLEEHRSRRPDSLAAAGRDAHIGTIILTERSFDGLKDECGQLSPLPPHVRFDDSGEFEVEMSFYDGYARDLNPKGLGMYDRLGLYYPTVKEVLADPAKQELISRHTGRQWSEGSRQEQIFDIALKFGQASRVHCPKERFDAAVDAVIERTTDPNARRFTPEQREVIMLAANCNGEDEYTGQFREVFFEQLHGKAREQMDGVNKAWVHDSLEEMRDLANGEVREAARGLHR